jgi:hypothetical protein
MAPAEPVERSTCASTMPAFEKEWEADTAKFLAELVGSNGQIDSRKAKAVLEIHKLIGAFPWVWLGPLYPPVFGLRFLEKLSKILADNLKDIEAGAPHLMRLYVIKMRLREHADKRTKNGEPVRIGLDDIEDVSYRMNHPASVLLSSHQGSKSPRLSLSTPSVVRSISVSTNLPPQDQD